MVTFRNELNFPLQRMILVEKGEDGYPLLQEGKIYYYGNENYYTEFTDTIDSIKSKWPSKDLVPDFYEILSVPYDPNDHTGVNSLYYLLRPNDPVYNIDLNTREVEAPPFLSVSGDH